MGTKCTQGTIRHGSRKLPKGRVTGALGSRLKQPLGSVAWRGGRAASVLWAAPPCGVTAGDGENKGVGAKITSGEPRGPSPASRPGNDMARFKSSELGVQLEPFCWSCDQPEPRHTASVKPVGYGQLCGPGPRRAAGAVGGSNPPIVLGLVTGRGLTVSSCSAAAGAPGLLPCGSEGELQYLQQLRRSAAVLAASEKDCCGACGTGAAPPIVPGLVTGGAWLRQAKAPLLRPGLLPCGR